MRTFTIQYVSNDLQPEGWTVFVDALPVIVADTPKEALAIALEMAERDYGSSGVHTVVMVHPGNRNPPILVQAFGVPLDVTD